MADADFWEISNEFVTSALVQHAEQLGALLANPDIREKLQTGWRFDSMLSIVPDDKGLPARLVLSTGLAAPSSLHPQQPGKYAPDNAELLDEAWGVIANAGAKQGGWESQDPEWVQAAIRWRDRWHATLPDSLPKAGPNA